MAKLLMIDNYDSFTYNLVHYLESNIANTVCTLRNDKIDIEEIENYDRIILSPGPGLPGKAGIMPELLKRFHDRKKILGICLGHQAIVEHFGGRLRHSGRVMHGVALPTFQTQTNEPIFNNIPKEFYSGRYHSWEADPNYLPPELRIIALDSENRIMGVRHNKYPIYGLQFHPESILTPHGIRMIENWMSS